LLKAFNDLKKNYKLIGDVRGWGLLLGIELVLDLKTLEPAPKAAKIINDFCKDNRVFVSIDGDLRNVIKIKPPVVFSIEDADLLLHTFKSALDYVAKNEADSKQISTEEGDEEENENLNEEKEE